MINVIVHDDKRIEDAENMIQISFANSRIGGGALSNGAL